MKRGGLSAGDIGAQYKYKNALVDVKVDTDSNVGSILFRIYCLKQFHCSINNVDFYLVWQISTTFTITDIIPSTKTIASFKVPDYNGGKVCNL